MPQFCSTKIGTKSFVSKETLLDGIESKILHIFNILVNNKTK